MIRLVKKAAQRGEHWQHKVGAVIIKNGKPISFGYNSYKTHPLMGNLKTLHAEVCAIIRVQHKIDLTGCTMIIFREHKDGSNAMSKPCPICERIIKEFGIVKIIYSTEGGWNEQSF